jgi:hypothetical protein
LATVENKNTFNKIIFTFFENNIKMCQDWINNKNKEEKTKEQNVNNKENEEKEFKCYPMKYFFKKYDTSYKKIIDIQTSECIMKFVTTQLSTLRKSAQ